MHRAAVVLLASAALAAVTTGCGSSASSSTSGSSAPATSASSSVGALAPEAQSAATGDIPDNQAFLTFTNPAAGYSISYPEGWTRKGDGRDVTFADKNNIVHVAVTPAGAATPAGTTAELNRLKQSSPTLTFTAPTTVHVNAGTAVKATYTTQSAPNPVTGKSVLLVVDRYELSRGAQRATVDLGSPKGVDNVDAYRMIINSFRWQ